MKNMLIRFCLIVVFIFGVFNFGNAGLLENGDGDQTIVIGGKANGSFLIFTLHGEKFTKQPEVEINVWYKGELMIAFKSSQHYIALPDLNLLAGSHYSVELRIGSFVESQQAIW